MIFITSQTRVYVDGDVKTRTVYNVSFFLYNVLGLNTRFVFAFMVYQLSFLSVFLHALRVIQ